MTPETNRIYLGDNRVTLKAWPDSCIDAVVTDPPYELGFMGKSWDSTGIAYDVTLWREVMRVMKPGAHLLAFGGTRTYHRMACAIEDAGFEIRDQLQWIYGQGFPKSLDVSKQLDKQASSETRRDRALRFTAWMRSTGITGRQINDATKTAMASHYLTDKEQPEIATGDMFDTLRPLLPSVPDDIEELVRWRTIEAENLKRRQITGTKMAVDAAKARPGVPGRDSAGRPLRGTKEITLTKAYTELAKKWEGWGTALKPANEPICLARKPLIGTVADNVMRWGTGALNIDKSRINFASAEDEDESKEKNQHADFGTAPGGNKVYGDFSMVPRANYDPSGRWPSNVIFDQYASGMLDAQESGISRFFYIAKPSGAERNMGINEGHLEPRQRDEGRQEGLPGGDNPRNRGAKAVANFHPTVKPVDLMSYLIRLVTPHGGLVLDPFLGSGTTSIAATRQGFQWVGCEMNPDYIAIAEKRVAAETDGRLL